MARSVVKRMWKSHAYRSALPEVTTPEPIAPVATEPAPLPARGGRPQHATWPRVMALVQHPVTHHVHADFVAEARTVSEAIAIASRYPFRALVISKSGGKEFTNGKSFEVGYV